VPDLTPLAFSVLGLLNESPMHPYDMLQTMIARSDDRNVKVRAGTLYHQVGRLQDLGYIVDAHVDREGGRPERTTYAITSAGQRALGEGLRRMVAEPADEYPVFHLALAEMENLERDEAIDAVRARIAALEARRRFYDDGLTEIRVEKQLAERFWLDVSYVRAMLSAQIEWLRATVERIESGDIPWDGPAVPPEGSNSKESTR
jgi:DNA-binding PadR family transcriptional regulator